MMDFWNANSTGVYSNEYSEDTLGETWYRGLQKSDEYGVVQVLTNVPGWYAGRAQHVHVKAHVNYTVQANDTITFGKIVHTGQLFFDQSTLTDVNKLWPYTLDTNKFTLNADDNVVETQQNTSYYDAFVESRSLGYNMSAGLVAFINIGIDPNEVPAAVGISSGSNTAPVSIPSGAIPSVTASAA
jgi:protocatechuate 3,4-dioxygenase beta subunit